RPLDPAVPPINSPLNSAITRQNPGPGGAVLAHPTSEGGGPTIVYRRFAFWFLNCRPQPFGDRSRPPCPAAIFAPLAFTSTRRSRRGQASRSTRRKPITSAPFCG